MALLILDRDGVINRDSANYIRNIADWVPIPGSIEAIASLSRAGFQVAIATNQSGLGRGYFTLDDMASVHQRLRQQVERHGGRIAGIYYCPHLPADGCRCRKPATGLLQAMEQDLEASARDAVFIGDSIGDLQAARNFGCRPVLVRTGSGADTLAALQSGDAKVTDPLSIPVYNDLAAAARAILAG